MSDTIHKFLFVAVLGVSIVFSRGYFAGSIVEKNHTEERGVLFSSAESVLPFSFLKATASNGTRSKAEIGTQTALPSVGVVLPEGSLTPQVAASDAGAGSEQYASPEEHGASFHSLKARAGLVADLSNGKEYFVSREDQRWPLASLTKLMTAVIVLERIDIQAAQGSLPNGATYRARDLLKLMLLVSNNDASEALAAILGRDSFLSAMNAKAQAWGMESTHFSDPVGLLPSNQSTSRDLKVLVAKIIETHPEILRTTRDLSATITELTSGKTETVKSNNIFAGRSDFIGGKTGYTDDAVGNLVSVFSYQGDPILIIVLGTDDRFGETEKLFSWLKEVLSGQTLTRF